MATKKMKINFKMPTPTAAERLHVQQQKNRKAAGLPDPSEYKKKLDAMKSEEVEQIDEISAELKASYKSKAKDQIRQARPFTKKGHSEYRDIAKNFIAKRQKGIAKASKVEEQLEKKGRFVSGPIKQPFKSDTILTSVKEEHLVHVSDGSNSHSKDVEHVKAGAKMHGGVYHDASDKGAFFKFNSHNDAKNFKHHVDKAPHKSVYADLHEETKVEEGVTIGGMVGRGNIHQYDRNPGPKDGNELKNVPFHAKTEKQKKLQNALNNLGKKMKETHPKLKEDYADPITIIKKGTNIKKKISANAYDIFKHHGFRKEEKDSHEYDYEGDMAKSDLRSIMHNAKELHDMIEDDTNLAEWCQAKITLAEDYLSTVANYMRSEMNEETMQEDKNDYQRKIEKNNKNFIAASKRQKNPLTNVHTAKQIEKNMQQKPVKEEVKDEYARKVDKYLKKKYGKDDVPFNKPYNKDTGTTTDKSGAKHTPMSKARHLAQQMMKKNAEKSVKESAAEPTEGEMKDKQQGYSRKAQIVKDIAKGKKSDNSEKFQKDPELSSEIHKT